MTSIPVHHNRVEKVFDERLLDVFLEKVFNNGFEIIVNGNVVSFLNDKKYLFKIGEPVVKQEVTTPSLFSATTINVAVSYLSLRDFNIVLFVDNVVGDVISEDDDRVQRELKTVSITYPFSDKFHSFLLTRKLSHGTTMEDLDRLFDEMVKFFDDEKEKLEVYDCEEGASSVVFPKLSEADRWRLYYDEE